MEQNRTFRQSRRRCERGIADNGQRHERGVEVNEVGFFAPNRVEKSRHQKRLLKNPIRVNRFAVASASFKMYELRRAAFYNLPHERRNSADVYIFIEARRGD